MPFKSEDQRQWMWKKKPRLAREWTDKYGSKVRLPNKVKSASRIRALRRSGKNA